MDQVQAATAAAVAAGLLGYASPWVVRRLPEPPEKPDADKTPRERQREEDEGPKEAYAAVADLPWFAPAALVTSAVAGGLVGATLGWSWLLAGFVLLVPVAVTLSIVDLRTRLLPAVVVLPATWTALALVVAHAALVASWDDLRRGLLAMALGYVFYWLLWFIYPVGLGYGDVRLAALLSLALGYVGWAEFLLGMYSGFLLLGVPGLVLAVVRRRPSYLKTQLPFGPYMCAGALVGLTAGPAALGHLVGG